MKVQPLETFELRTEIYSYPFHSILLLDEMHLS
jgi:hypothetical protein